MDIREASEGQEATRIGPYRIVRRLGQGGMGAVYEAVHELIGRKVAIKVLHPQYAADAELTERFFNEARAVNLVDHPGLVQVSDYGRLADGTSYIVMEFLKGETLGQRLRRLGTALPASDVVRLVWQIADSLLAAHEKGIVHRDLKPDNIMLVPDPHVPGGERTKLLDFGIAKLGDGWVGRDGHTVTGTVLGTPAYMAPEQCAGSTKIDAKADVYSLGCVLYHMLSGRPPFVGEGPGAVLGMQQFVEPEPLAKRAPAAPLDLIVLTHELLRKRREDRPTMTVVLARLRNLANLPAGATSANSPSEDDLAQALGAETRADAPRETLSSRSTLAATASQSIAVPQGKKRASLSYLALGFALVAAAAAVGILVRRGPPPSQTERPPAADPAQPPMRPAPKNQSSTNATAPLPTVAAMQPRAHEPSLPVADDRKPAEAGPGAASQSAGPSAAPERLSERAASALESQRKPSPRHSEPQLTRVGTGHDTEAHPSGKPSPSNAPSPPAKTSDAELLTIAEGFLKDRNFREALRTASVLDVYETDPPRASRIVGLAACTLKDTYRAQIAYKAAKGPAREEIVTACRVAGIPVVEDHIRTAETLLKRGYWEEALRTAVGNTDTLPRSNQAWVVIGIASCHLHDGKTAARALAAMDASFRPGVLRACSSAGIQLSASATGTSEDAGQVLSRAWDAYQSRKWAQAMSLADEAIRKGLRSGWVVVGLAACETGDHEAEQKAFDAALPEDRNRIKTTCAQRRLPLRPSKSAH